MTPDYQPFDLGRMFIGDFSILLTLEIAVRTIFMYVFALLVVRFIGKRGIGQITPFEYVIVFALGSATGDPMFYPSVPLLHGMVVLTLIVILQKAFLSSMKRSHSFERAMSSTPTLVIENGAVVHERLNSEGISHDELLMRLRLAGVRNVGQVQYAFLEPSGALSVFKIEGDTKLGETTLTPIGEGA